MSTPASYDELIKHVLSLEMENSQLRRELLYGSTGRLETDQVFKAPTSGEVGHVQIGTANADRANVTERSTADASAVQPKIKPMSQEHNNLNASPSTLKCLISILFGDLHVVLLQ